MNDEDFEREQEANISVAEDGRLSAEIPADLPFIVKFLETMVAIKPKEESGGCRICSDYENHSSLSAEQIGAHISAYMTEFQTPLPTYTAIDHQLVGSTLSPSLTGRGWKVWKQPAITGSDASAVKLAAERSYKSVKAMTSRMRTDAESNADALTMMNGASEAVEVFYTALEQLVVELKPLV